MSKQITFNVNGEPKGKGRPRFYRMGKGVCTYTDSETLSYENRVLMCYKNALKELGIEDTGIVFPRGYFVEMVVDCYFSLNKGDYGKKGLNKSGRCKLDNYYCDKKPDIDNIIKSIQDGLNGVAYDDDCQVVSITANKIYIAGQSRVEVTLRNLNY